MIFEEMIKIIGVSVTAAAILTVVKEFLMKMTKANIRIGGAEFEVSTRESKEAYEKLLSTIAELREHPQVFIAYPHAQRDFALKLCADLVSTGVKVWLDEQEIKPGETISRKIKEGMNESQWIVLIPPAEEHNKGWVFKEMQMALEAEKLRGRPIIIPVKTPTNVIPNIFSDRLWADFSDKYEEGLHNLLRGIVRKAEISKT